ncbi:MAG: saccharopine dehydrogenase NADP-binding domain-containing protein [Cellvibrionaceae bacterium]
MKVLIVGGYGNFGRRLVKSLVEFYDYEVIIAGRSLDKANIFRNEIASNYGKNIDVIQLDIFSPNLAGALRNISPDVVVNASGPFQYQLGDNNYSVARACIESNSHYVDFADDRDFVTNFQKELSELAQSRKLMLVSGASTVPGLTAAVLDHFSATYSQIHSIQYGISPGNRTERGEGTIASILSYTGKPFTTVCNGKQQTIHGWQGLDRHDFGFPLGKRWMGNCNIPDLDLLLERYPSLKTVIFQAGLEVSILHLGLWFLSFFSRFGIVKNWSRYSSVITRMSEWFVSLGTDSGGMFVNLKGLDNSGQEKNIYWQLVAENGEGPNVPTIPAELLIKRLSKGDVQSGAMPCMGLFTLGEFFDIASRWGIYQKEIGND